MDILKQANSIREKIAKYLTKNIGSIDAINNFNYRDAYNVKRVLIVRTNHRSGNRLVMTALLIEVSEIFPNCTIDLFVKGNLAPKFFENFSNIDKIIELPKKSFKNIFQYIKAWFVITLREYDIVINVDKGS
jgi:ADP-heptose:LPS heptosyltransferase